MLKMKQKEILKSVKENSISFEDFYHKLLNQDIGNWDNVNSEDIIKQYVYEMSSKGIHVSHILEAIENDPSQYELFEIWLGNSMETPKPINSKIDLYYALGLEYEFGEII